MSEGDVGLKILVCGASGFVGRNLLLNLPKEWDVVATYNTYDLPSFVEKNGLRNINSIHVDFKDGATVKILSNWIFDCCVYLVADTVGASVDDISRHVENNVQPLVNFLQVYRGYKLVFLSSGAVYMGLTGQVSPALDVKPTIPWAITNHVNEQYIRFVSKRLDRFGHVILRFFGAYGPYEAPRKISAKLLSYLMSDEKEFDFTIYGDGENLIDIMYVDDAIEGILAAVNGDAQNITVDLCRGNPLSINEYVKTVSMLWDKKVRLHHKDWSPEYITFNASPEGMLKHFDWKPKVPLREGFQRYLAIQNLILADRWAEADMRRDKGDKGDD